MIESPFAEAERESSAEMEERCGVLLPKHYGDTDAEYRHVQQAAGLFDGSFMGLIELTGGERLRWLNGQITQDVKALPPGDGTRGAVLTAKGHVLAEAAVYGCERAVWVACQQDRLETVRDAFDQHIIADDVLVNVAAGWAHLVLAGPATSEVVQRAMGLDLSAIDHWRHREAVIGKVPVRVVGTHWLSAPTCDLYVPREHAGAVWRHLLAATGELRPIGMAALDILRVEAGWPWLGVDFTETNLLLEALSRDHVSFTKGCYVGQEVVIRAEHQGHLNRRLCGVAISGGVIPERGAACFLGERAVGTLGSAVRSPRFGTIGLAMLRRDCWDPGTEISVETSAGRQPAKAVSLPFSAS